MADEMLTEEWRVVEGWPDYEVSSMGGVRRARPLYFTNPQNRKQCIRFHAGRPLKPFPDKDGYLFVVLAMHGQKRTSRINSLVCTAFHGPRPTEEHHAAHENGINTHNSAHNLSWKTPMENGADKIRHGTPARGEKNANSVLTAESVISMRLDMEAGTETMLETARRYGVSLATAEAIKYRRLWKHL